MRLKVVVIAGLMTVFLSCVVSAFEETRNLQVGAEEISQCVIECGAGSLEIIGRDSLDEVRVQAVIYVKHVSGSEAQEFLEDHLDLSLERRNNRAVLISKIDTGAQGFWKSFFNSVEARVDVRVEMPADMVVTVTDGSGETDIRNVAVLDVTDGSGKLTITDTGRLDITDGSGDIHISSITGNVRIDDGSGGIVISRVEGDIKVEDGSGSIEIDDVVGEIDLDDHSGGITVQDVDGSVLISDESGSIEVRRVTADVVVRNDGSGGISLHDVAGTVQTPD